MIKSQMAFDQDPAARDGESDAMDASPMSGITHREFLEKALSTAAAWTRYADPKALAVLVLLGLGLSDLIRNASRFARPASHAGSTCDLVSVSGHGCGSVLATAGFVIACAAALAVVYFVTVALFPRLSPKGLLAGDRAGPLPKSRFYFGEVSRYGSQEAYYQAVLACSQQDLMRDLAGQVYEVAKVGAAKHLAARRAYVAVLVFLVFWAAARLLLVSAE